MSLLPQLTILLIEDDIAECESMKSYIQTLNDIALVGVTGSAYEGMKLLSQLKPDVIILDLELSDGNGITFLEDMQLMRLNYRPFVFVTTRTRADVVRDAVESLGAQYFYCKNNPAYSPKTVIGVLKSLFRFTETRTLPDFVCAKPKQSSRNLNEQKDLRKTVSILLAHLSIAAGKDANSYFTEAVLLVKGLKDKGTQSPELKNDVYPIIAKKYGIKPDSVDRNMRYALDNAWARTPVAAINQYYPFPIAADRDAPSPKEFIFNIASCIED